MNRYRGRVRTTTFGATGDVGGFRPGAGFGDGEVVDVGEATYERPDDGPGEISPGR